MPRVLAHLGNLGNYISYTLEKAKHQLTPTITLAESYFEALGSSRRRTKKRYPETKIPDDIFEEIQVESRLPAYPFLA